MLSVEGDLRQLHLRSILVEVRVRLIEAVHGSRLPIDVILDLDERIEYLV